MKLFLMVIGMVFIVEGFPFFISPDKWKEAIVYILRIDNRILRLIGLGMMLFGILLIYIGRDL